IEVVREIIRASPCDVARGREDRAVGDVPRLHHRESRSATANDGGEAEAEYASRPRDELSVTPPVDHIRTHSRCPDASLRMRIEHDFFRLALRSRVDRGLWQRTERSILISLF